MRKLLFVAVIALMLGAFVAPAEAQKIGTPLFTEETSVDQHEGLDTFVVVTYGEDRLENGQYPGPFGSAPPSADQDFPTVLPLGTPTQTVVRIMSVSAAEFINKHPDVTLQASMDGKPWQKLAQLADGSWIVPIKCRDRKPGPVNLQLQLRARNGVEAKKLKLFGIIPTRWIPFLGKKLNPKKNLFQMMGQVLRFEGMPCPESDPEGIFLWLVHQRNVLARVTTGMVPYFPLTPEFEQALREEEASWANLLPPEEDLATPETPTGGVVLGPGPSAPESSEVLSIRYAPDRLGGTVTSRFTGTATVHLSNGQKIQQDFDIPAGQIFLVQLQDPARPGQYLQAWGELTGTSNGKPVKITFDSRTKTTQGGR